jgi:hypothetical protein
MIRSRLLQSKLIALFVLGSPALRAQSAPILSAPPADPAPAAPAGPRSTAPLAVYLSLASPSDFALTRAAIERELGVPVAISDSPTAPLRVVVDVNRASVSFRTSAGEELARTIDLPENPERRAEVIALLVGNLTRNEAADLLVALQKAEADAASSASPAKLPEKSAPVAALPSKPEPPPLIRSFPFVNLSLYHPIALRRDSERRVLLLELGLAYSHVGAIEGVGVSFGALRVEQHSRGLALGALYSRVDGPVRGFHGSAVYAVGGARTDGILLGGVVARTAAPINGLGLAGALFLGDDVVGTSIAGAANISGRVRGAAIGGAFTFAKGPVQGLLLGGAFTSAKSMEGIDISTVNLIRGPAAGISISAIADIAQEHSGVAISGLANITGQSRGFVLGGLANLNDGASGLLIAGLANRTGDLSGVAFAPINVGARVRGVQLGFVNIASEVDGAQIGAVNIARNGRIQAEAFADNLIPLNAGIKFVSGYAYSELLAHYIPSKNLSGLSGGLGAHIPAGPAYVELGARGVFSFDDTKSSETPERMDLCYQGRVGLRVTSFLEPFVTGGARHGLFHTGYGDVEPEFGAGVALF